MPTSRRQTDARRLGTFEGVFVPTTLTILGVILFTRTGWAVGQAGLAGALGVIVAAYAVSTATTLSLASIVTNVRVGAGGAFALLTRTLGMEPGGSIGLPLYLSQAFAIVLYLFGFREGWLWIFPTHPAWAVDLGAFAVVFLLAGISARLAFRTQYVVLGLVAVAVGSVALGLPLEGATASPSWTRPEDGASWWEVFAVFFPAVTGIMAGVNLSGDLATPRVSIRRGALSAVALTFVVYTAMAVVLALRVPAETLRSSETALVDASPWAPLALAGLLGATFSSALSTAVGAPRILEALAQHELVPAHRWLSHRTRWHEPVPALAATGLLVLGGIALRDLNAVAPLITLFFLLTYGAINGTLLVQQALRLPRFRPSFRVPLVVPAVGTVGCVVAMVAISWPFALLALLVVGGLYALLVRRGPVGPYGQVRAGAVVGLLGWALGRLGRVRGERPWQARIVLPLRDVSTVEGLEVLLGPLVARGGSISLLALGEDAEEPPALDDLVERWTTRGIAVRGGRAPGEDPVAAVTSAVGALDAGLVAPNLLLLPWGDERAGWDDAGTLSRLATDALVHDLGLWLVDVDGACRDAGWDRVVIHLQAEALEHPLGPAGLPLVLLAVWRWTSHWGCRIEVEVFAGDEEDLDALRARVDELFDGARVPVAARRVTRGRLGDAVQHHAGDPDALHVVVPSRRPSLERVEDLRRDASGRLVVALLSGEARSREEEVAATEPDEESPDREREDPSASTDADDEA